MDFICLAAGQGTRLGRLGGYLQKCMYPVGLEPFLEHTLRQLLASGLASPGRDRIGLVVGHRAEQVRSYFGDEFVGLPIEYVVQSDRRGTGHALRLAMQALRPHESVIAWLADLFVTEEMFRQIGLGPHPQAVTLADGHVDESPVLRATTEGQLVKRVWEGEGPLVDVGLWKLSTETLARMGEAREPGEEMRMLLDLQKCIDDGARVGFVVADEWIHLGGTLPSAQENVRWVVQRVQEIADEGDR